tara:strand:+ start:8234 stop:8578 length:345 start_codon:yes stop_codon:yes gene_type:complete
MVAIGENTLTFLRGVQVINYLIFVVWIFSYFGVRMLFTTNRRKYVRMLNTFFTLCVGIILVSLRFPFLIDLNSKKALKEVTTLMFTAGLIVLSTIRPEEVAELWGLITSPNIQS